MHDDMTALKPAVPCIEPLIGGAVIAIRGFIVAEPPLGKAPVADSRAALGAGNIGCDAGPLARGDVLAHVISHVGDGIDPVDAEKVLRRPGCFSQKTQIASRVGDMLFGD